MVRVWADWRWWVDPAASLAWLPDDLRPASMPSRVEHLHPVSTLTPLPTLLPSQPHSPTNPLTSIAILPIHIPNHPPPNHPRLSYPSSNTHFPHHPPIRPMAPPLTPANDLPASRTQAGTSDVPHGGTSAGPSGTSPHKYQT